MNPLRQIFKEGDVPAYRLAPVVGLSRNTIAKIISRNGIPEEAQIKTLNKLAKYFGYRVEINLVKHNGLEEVKDDHRTKNHHP